MREMYKFENDLSPPLMDGICQVRKNTFRLRHFRKIPNNKKLCKNESGDNMWLCISPVESVSI